MSFATPPGWYPDAETPGTERWWDGTAWTAHTRASAAAHPAPHEPAHPPYAPQAFGPPTAPPPPRGGSRTRVLAITLSSLLVLGAALTAAVLLGPDDSGTRAAPGPTASDPAPTAPATSATPSPEGSPDGDPGVLVDQLNGITLAVPDGWEKVKNTSDDAPTIRTAVSYDCPGTSASFCYRGTVSTRTARAGQSDPKAIAEADISTAADKAYEEDVLGRRTHGGITSHRVLKAEPVAVAGRTGYLVRWRVVTAKGPGGVVQSVAFPSTVGSETPVIVRLAFDADRPELPVSLMDTITRSVRPIGDSATSGGVGASIGP
ncbi:DUF2510 domain-containing protein [Streptomyces cyaneofuscatus]|uniref:DUF2510 domain-containing protein n=1 Tax=Streptomyces cyaneofuscatus TaxID=66883 RepID=UPI0013DBCD2A|nr:DUF2510 domain-containing protein [Streptomyces cyaneofuscatus]NDZ68292.1 DUF2510 domain-containing protein [Streptomyces cyaneofuscatus]